VKVYEVAIACGYFCLSAGFYFTFRLGAWNRRSGFVVCSLLGASLAGLSFGLAIGARPHLGIAAVAVLVLLLFQGRSFFRKDMLAFIAPVILCGLAILAYNYARFDNPLEFGTRYLMGGDAYRNFHLSPSNFVHGVYYLLLCPPELVPEFPFVRLALGDPLDSFTRDLTTNYFLEPIGGVLTVCPLILVVFLVPVWRELWTNHRAVFGLLAAMLATVAGTVLVLIAVPFSSQRYDVDFLPYLLLVACVAASLLLTTIRPKSLRIAAMIGVTAMLLYSITANLALGIQGPYDQFVQSSPASYVNLASWFSPIDRFRPLLNPALHIAAVFDFTGPCPSSKQPLISTGEFGSRYMLSVECADEGRIRLISQDSILNPDERRIAVPFTSPGSYEIGLDFTPNDSMMTVTWNRNIVLRYPLRFLVTSRSQVHLGWDPSMGNQNTFQGHITLAPSWIWDTDEESRP
jgi:hypothetical protein